MIFLKSRRGMLHCRPAFWIARVFLKFLVRNAPLQIVFLKSRREMEHLSSAARKSMIAKETFDFRCRTISSANPNYFRQMAIQKTKLMKVGIFRNNGEVVGPRKLPTQSLPALAGISRRTGRWSASVLRRGFGVLGFGLLQQGKVGVGILP
jgi:hypothetical protein